MSSDEFAFIDWLRQRTRPKDARVAIGIGDDMAAVRWPSGLVLITCDIRLDTVHFVWAEHGPELVGRKAIACSLSDCAAMAALPRAAVISVALNKNVTMDEAKRLAGSMIDTAKAFGCEIVGGDTTAWKGPTAIDVTMLGEVPDKPPADPAQRRQARRYDLRDRQARRIDPRPAHDLRAAGATGPGTGGHGQRPRHDRHQRRPGGRPGPHLRGKPLRGGAGEGTCWNRSSTTMPVDWRDRTARHPLDHALHDGEDFELVLAGDARGLDPLVETGKLLRIGADHG